jgi:hypothetical protein
LPDPLVPLCAAVDKPYPARRRRTSRRRPRRCGRRQPVRTYPQGLNISTPVP